jgi:hypothetical protein
VRAALAAMHRGTLEMWFVTPRFHFLGWLAVPAWIYAFFRHPRSFASMVIAWAALAFIAVVATFYAGYEPERLSLPAVVCMLFLIAQMLDDLGRWAKRRLPERWKRVPVAHIPLIAAVVVMALFPGQTIGNARRSIDSFNRQGMRPPAGIFRQLPSRMCAAMDRNALVAAANPWNVQLWCGNAAFWLPPDLDSQEVLDRYLAEIRPAFIVANTGRPRLWPKQADPKTRNAVFESAPQLQKIVAGSGLAIYRVLEPKPYEPGWTAPPPLVRMGVE